ncbi:rod shape-determining protein RodA [Clostridia bacterium]|nr:rod shape-determining protein RodA [Clostridia bacterium]
MNHNTKRDHIGAFIGDVKDHFATLDWVLVICVAAASVYGIVLVKSATNYMETSRYLIVQSGAIIIGAVLMYVISKADYDHMLKYTRGLFAAAVVLLLMTLIFGTGMEETGNRSWIRIPVPGGSVGGQPSEIVKVLFILTFSRHLDKVKENINNLKNIVLLILHFAIIFALVLAQGDLGSALIFFFIFAAMCFSAGMSLWIFLGGIFTVVAASPLLWTLLSERQQNRILVGFNPALDPTGLGYQPLRSQRAIGSGGFIGAGFQKGYITQNGMIPEQENDFIFSVAGEEFGFVGAIIVIALLTLIIVKIFLVAKSARNDVGFLICIGVMAMFIAQTVENIGMALGLLPVIGVTLPFFSSGGSSILGSFLAVSLVLSVHSRRNIYYFTREEVPF